MSFKYPLPITIKKIINDSELKEISIGCSDSQVVRIKKENKTFYLKIMKENKLLQEYKKLMWLSTKLPVPKIIDFVQEYGNDYLITEEMPGKMLCDEYYINNPDISILSTAYETFPEKHIIVHPKSVRYLDLFRCCVITHPSVMYRTGSLREYKLKYKESYICSQDYELWARAIRYLKIANLDSVLLRYRLNPKSITQKRQDLALNEDRRIRATMLDFLTKDITLQKQMSEIILGVHDIKEVEKKSLIQEFFSLRNINKHKVLTILGIKFKFRREM